jgi:hypothetical protein
VFLKDFFELGSAAEPVETLYVIISTKKNGKQQLFNADIENTELDFYSFIKIFISLHNPFKTGSTKTTFSFLFFILFGFQA